VRLLVGAVVAGAALGVGAALAFPQKADPSARTPKKIEAPIPLAAAARPTAPRTPTNTTSRAAVTATPTPTAKRQDSADRAKMEEAMRLRGQPKVDDILKNPYWNPNKVTLDGAQREALLAKIHELAASADSAWSTWSAATGIEADKAQREGNFTLAIASPPGFQNGMTLNDRVPDPDEGSSITGTGGAAFSLALFTYFSPQEYPALGVLKGAYNKKLLELHDGVQQFFADAAKGR
jgi:hypothetical protein